MSIKSNCANIQVVIAHIYLVDYLVDCLEMSWEFLWVETQTFDRSTEHNSLKTNICKRGN